MEFRHTVLGIEFGSTRIKAVLIDEQGIPLASGNHDWENHFENGIWTYSLAEVKAGLQSAYRALKAEVKEKYGVALTELGAIGISAMMHGYLVFDKDDELLVPFRTWRNNNAAEAAIKLTELFSYPIPARWSIAHLYQAMLNGEAHLPRIAFQTTLEGYVHYLLTGKKVIGIDEASGMFPIDLSAKTYDAGKAELFDAIVKERNLPWTLEEILPKVLLAGEDAGSLTEEGARLLDPEGDLRAGIPLCPPEGDAATGMVATNAVRVRTGNVSAGTSIFGMVVLEGELKRVHPEIDLVTTPVGDLVAMVHCNNCTSDINAWVDVFGEFAKKLGVTLPKWKLYDTLYEASLEGEADCGGVLSYNYVSGENITGVEEGRPLLVRKTESKFSLANLMRAHLYSTMATLKLGLDILLKEEGVALDSVVGHGGLFKTEDVCQQYLANAIHAPVTVMQTAGEGGAWGMALLALYRICGAGLSLADFLEREIFSSRQGKVLYPNGEAEGMEAFIAAYRDALPVVKKAVEVMK